MKKYISILSIVVAFCLVSSVSAQYSPVLNGSLHGYTPAAQTLPSGAQLIEVARITLTASNADIYINGFMLGTDVPGGLRNFSNIHIYDAYNNTQLGVYPQATSNPDLVQVGNIIIGNGQSKTYYLKASLADIAAGQVRLGFAGFSFPTETAPTLVGFPVYGNTLTLPGVVTATATPTPVATVVPTATPMLSVGVTPSSRGFTTLAALGLAEGNTISAAGSDDPDIYIANEWGYKRLFLNPVIFGFYGHLGGFSKVKTIAVSTRDKMVTSGLFRNCETNDEKVYGLESKGEDMGVLHWVNTTGAQAVSDDPEFFKKVFCINTNEFNWYSQGAAYTSVNQVPAYSR
jgi:hypothetical protein